jgi:hypothetical protein
VGCGRVHHGAYLSDFRRPSLDQEKELPSSTLRSTSVKAGANAGIRERHVVERDHGDSTREAAARMRHCGHEYADCRSRGGAGAWRAVVGMQAGDSKVTGRQAHRAPSASGCAVAPVCPGIRSVARPPGRPARRLATSSTTPIPSIGRPSANGARCRARRPPTVSQGTEQCCDLANLDDGRVPPRDRIRDCPLTPRTEGPFSALEREQRTAQTAVRDGDRNRRASVCPPRDNRLGATTARDHHNSGS